MTVQTMSMYCLLAFAIIVVLFALLILWKMFRGDISLDGLLSEPPAPGVDMSDPGAAMPKASLSRFQFMLFTFVIAGLYLLLSIEAGTFIDIPTNVLGLLGISGGSYLVSKAVSSNTGTGTTK